MHDHMESLPRLPRGSQEQEVPASDSGRQPPVPGVHVSFLHVTVTLDGGGGGNRGTTTVQHRREEIKKPELRYFLSIVWRNNSRRMFFCLVYKRDMRKIQYEK